MDRIARGIYLPSELSAADWDQIEAATWRADATICLTSALAYHDLTDAIPAALDVAIPRGSRTPASAGAISWHQFDRSTFEIGREQVTIPGSAQAIGIYSPERSIDIAVRLPRAKSPVLQALEMMGRATATQRSVVSNRPPVPPRRRAEPGHLRTST